LLSRKSLIVGALALALITPFAVPANAAQTVVTLATWGSSPAETEALNDAIATFEVRNPTIDVQQVVHNDHGAQMIAKFASKTPPDVFYLDAGIAQDWAAQGILEDLTKYVNASNFSLTAFNKSYLAPFKTGSALYGLPKDANPLVLEGNKTLMARAGIKTLPTTIAQFDSAAKLLLAKKITPMCVDADINRLGAYFYSFGGSIATGTKSGLNSAGTKAALTWALTNYKTGAFKTPAQLSAGWAGEAFGKGLCAFTMEGAWLDPYLRDAFPNVAASMIKGQLPAAKSAGSLAFTAAYAIGKDSTNKDAAWAFIQYMTGARGMGVWTSYGVAIPSRSDVAIPVGYEVNGQAAKAKTTVTTPSFVGWNKVIDAFNNETKKQVQDKNMNVAKAVASIISKTSAAFPK
jgi:multiple sugar transport system substrate-binding protein